MFGATLDSMTRNSHLYPQVGKDEVSPGDWVIIRTLRSEYVLRVLDDGLYEVHGGWFEKNGCSPTVTGVAGATWGGNAIMPKLLAACGLRVEFRNRLITSPVRSVVVIPKRLSN